MLSFVSVGDGAGQIRVDTGLKNLFFEGTEIGTFARGTGMTALVVTLNGASNATSVTALLRSLPFAATGTAGNRTMTVKMMDLGTGGATNATVSKTIAVS